jgi:DNA-binding winged helix-turn-helix (wHTH) protein/Flp pilus assembly protein TadD
VRTPDTQTQIGNRPGEAPAATLEPCFHLGPWRIDPRSGEICRPGDERRLEPKPMAVLLHLAGAAGRVVSKEELMDAVWPDACVAEDSVWRSIHTLRKALEHDGGDGSSVGPLIETVPKRGYRLVAPVEPAEAGNGMGGGGAPAATAAEPVPAGRRRAVAGWWLAGVLLAGGALLLGAREIGRDLDKGNPVEERPVEERPAEDARADDRPTVAELLAGDLSAEDFFERGRDFYDGQIQAGAYPPADLDRAIALFEKAIALDPELAVAHAELASARFLRAIHAGELPYRVDEAAALAETALRLDPDLPEAHKALGLIYRHQGRLEEAERELELALALRPDYTAAIDALATLRMSRGRVREAVALRKRLVGTELPQAKVLSFLGCAYARLGEQEEARRHYFATLDHEPFHVVATRGLAELEVRDDRVEEARRRLEAAVAVHPDSLGLLHDLAQLAILEGDLETARRWLDRAVELPDGRYVRTLVRHVWVRHQLGETEGLEAELDNLENRCLQALENGDQYPVLHLYLAMIDGMRGRIRSGLARVEEAIELGFTDAEALAADPIFGVYWEEPGFEELLARAEDVHARRSPG